MSEEKGTKRQRRMEAMRLSGNPRKEKTNEKEQKTKAIRRPAKETNLFD
jgi:hypothetical protein